MNEFDDIYWKMVNSPESKTKKRIWMFKNNFHICDANYRDLIIFSDKINKSYNEIRQNTDYMGKVELINLDLLRRISNYLSSAFTLVSYARTFMDKNYAGTEIQEVYNEKIKEYFHVDTLSRFIQDLRNYFLHNGLNSFAYGVRAEFDKNMGVSFYTILMKDKLLVGDYLKADARKYLETLPTQIDIIAEIKKYHDRVQKFYQWLFDYLGECHKEEIRIASEYQKRYFELLSELGNKE